MPLTNNVKTCLRDLDAFQSKSRFLVAQNRSKQQHRQLSMLSRLASEMDLTFASLKA